MGITTADRYVRTLAECVGSDLCYRFAAKGQISFEDILTKAAQTLVYGNPDMEVQEKDQDKIRASMGDVEIPKNTLMVFRHVLTTPRKDRDGDILRSEGAEVDPRMPLLWQHVHTLPIGKMLRVVDQSEKGLVLTSAIVDVNELAHDAAVMVDNGMLRFSHGFRAHEYEQIKEKDGTVSGFDIKRFEVMEESLVSVPSNADAEVDELLLSLVEGGKLVSPFLKETGRSLREKRNVQVPGVEIGQSCECQSKEAEGAPDEAQADPGVPVGEEGKGTKDTEVIQFVTGIQFDDKTGTITYTTGEWTMVNGTVKSEKMSCDGCGHELECPKCGKDSEPETPESEDPAPPTAQEASARFLALAGPEDLARMKSAIDAIEDSEKSHRDGSQIRSLLRK